MLISFYYNGVNMTTEQIVIIVGAVAVIALLAWAWRKCFLSDGE